MVADAADAAGTSGGAGGADGSSASGGADAAGAAGIVGPGRVRPDTVRDLIDRQALERPGACYAIAAAADDGAPDREPLDFSGLAASCREVSRHLRALGSRPGDTVSLVMPNGLGTLRLLLGALHGGWCVHPVNLLSQPDQMRYVLDHADGRLALVAPEWADRVRGLMSTIARPIPVVVADPDTGRFGDGDGVGAGRIDADSAAARRHRRRSRC